MKRLVFINVAILLAVGVAAVFVGFSHHDMCAQDQVGAESGVTAWRRDCGAITRYKLVLVRGAKFPRSIWSPSVIAVADYPERFSLETQGDTVVLSLPASVEVFSQNSRFSMRGETRHLLIQRF